jgi:hypothetical protein
LIDHYDWPGGREVVMRFGPASGPVVIMLLPLFDEYNRTRSFAVGLARLLAAQGLAVMLPDLPGQAESIVPTEHATLEAWRQALDAIVRVEARSRPVHLAVMRGAALLDDAAGVTSVWRFAPVPGHAVLSDLRRAEAINGRKDWSAFSIDSPPANLVGNAIGWPLYAALEAHGALATPDVPCRTVRLDSDPAVADVKLAGTPLWRRAEPGDDPALARLLADDLVTWVGRCGA